MAHTSCAGLCPSYIHACVYMNTCEHDVNAYVCMCMCVRVYVCGRMHKCMHIYIYEEIERERESLVNPDEIQGFRFADMVQWISRQIQSPESHPV